MHLRNQRFRFKTAKIQKLIPRSSFPSSIGQPTGQFPQPNLHNRISTTEPPKQQPTSHPVSRNRRSSKASPSSRSMRPHERATRSSCRVVWWTEWANCNGPVTASASARTVRCPPTRATRWSASKRKATTRWRSATCSWRTTHSFSVRWAPVQTWPAFAVVRPNSPCSYHPNRCASVRANSWTPSKASRSHWTARAMAANRRRR